MSEVAGLIDQIEAGSSLNGIDPSIFTVKVDGSQVEFGEVLHKASEFSVEVEVNTVKSYEHYVNLITGMENSKKSQQTENHKTTFSDLDPGGGMSQFPVVVYLSKSESEDSYNNCNGFVFFIMGISM